MIGSTGRLTAALAVASTALALGVLVAGAHEARWPLVVVVAAALLWGTGGTVAVLASSSRPDVAPTAPGRSVRVGTLMHLGGVPDDVARISSAVAATVGPVVLMVPEGREAPPRLDPGVVVHRDGAGNPVDRLADRCEAVLVTSARVLPDVDGCRSAARRLAAGASWVTGSARALNRDRFGPAGRDRLDALLRRRVAGGRPWLWEPDATVVRTRLLRSHPVPVGRPLGAWLRDRAAEGLVGATVDETLARRAAPVAAHGYWPDTTARQRAAVADLADAAVAPSTPWRARLVASGLLARALSGWSALLWMVALVLLAGGSPVRAAATVPLVVAVTAGAVLRWLAVRLAVGVRPAPVADLVAALYAVPGSLAAVPSALSRRIRPARRPVPTRPLVWLALVATVASAGVLLTARPGDGVARAAAAAAAVLLVLLWVFTVRSLVERTWARTGFRIPLDVPVSLDRGGAGAEAADRRLVDGSPGGFALRGPVSGLAIGDEFRVRGPQGLVLEGTVAARRRNRGTELLGAELRAVRPGTGAWAALLVEGATGPAGEAPARVVEQRTDDRGSRLGRWVDRAAVALVVTTSVAVVAALVLVLAGVRPLVVRSGSMEPTYSVGDVVLVVAEPAADLRPGEVVTRFDAPEAFDSLTHRVRDVERGDGTVTVETRGDANDVSEVWTVPDTDEVGVVVAALPAIGAPLALLRSSALWAGVLGLAVLALIGVLLRPRRRLSDDAEHAATDPHLKVAATGPTEEPCPRTSPD